MTNETMQSILIKTSLWVMLFTANCYPSSSQTMKVAPQNPTSYTFMFNIREVRDAIMKEFLKLPGYRYMKLDYVGKDVILSETAKEIFQSKDNQNDFYLGYSGSIGESKIYFSNKMFKSSGPGRAKVNKGEPLDYYAEFHLHLESIDSTHIRVEIFTINPRVVVGEKLLPSFPHFGSNPKIKSVQRSTIEEYEILLRIGKGLGVDDKMPKIKLP